MSNGNNTDALLDILSPEAASKAKALAAVLQDQRLENENKQRLDQENDQDNDQEQEAKFKVFNGNSYVKNSGNSRSKSEAELVFLIFVLLFGDFA